MAKRARAKLPGVVWAAGWVSFCSDAATELIFGVLPAFYLNTLTLGIVWVGMIEGLAETVVSMTKLFSGHLSDRSGARKPWMLFGYSLSGLSKPLLALVTGGVGVTILRTADRFGKGLRGAPRDALVAQAITQEQRGQAFGIQRSMDHAGALMGGLLAAVLLLAGAAPKTLMLLSAVPALATVLVIIFFIKEPARTPKPREPFSLRQSWRHASPELKKYIFAASIYALSNSSDLLLLALCYERFKASGLDDAQAMGLLPLLWALLHVVKTTGVHLGGAISDRVGRIPLLVGAWMAYALVYAGAALFAHATHPAWAFVLFVLYGFVAILQEGPERAIVADFEPNAQRRGTAYGLLDFMTGILLLPASLLAVGLWKAFGADVAMAVDAAIAFVAALALAMLFPRHKQRAQSSSEPAPEVE
ncbi:MAG: MFS transporter [Phycisphaerales bacterium]|nr:MFS transporter [Phycisphaerales bacterium]